MTQIQNGRPKQQQSHRLTAWNKTVAVSLHNLSRHFCPFSNTFFLLYSSPDSAQVFAFVTSMAWISSTTRQMAAHAHTLTPRDNLRVVHSSQKACWWPTARPNPYWNSTQNVSRQTSEAEKAPHQNTKWCHWKKAEIDAVIFVVFCFHLFQMGLRSVRALRFGVGSKAPSAVLSSHERRRTPAAAYACACPSVGCAHAYAPKYAGLMLSLGQSCECEVKNHNHKKLFEMLVM